MRYLDAYVISLPSCCPASARTPFRAGSGCNITYFSLEYNSKTDGTGKQTSIKCNYELCPTFQES